MRRLSWIGICCILLASMLAMTFADDEADYTRQKRQFGVFFNGLASGYGYPVYGFGRYPYYRNPYYGNSYYYGNPYFYGGGYRSYYRPYRYGYDWGSYY